MPATTTLEIILRAKDEASAKVDKISKKFKNFGSAATSAGKKVGFVSVPLALVVGKAIQTAAAFDDVIKTVLGTAKAGGAAAEELKLLEDIALEFGQKGVFGAQQVATAMLDMVRDGLKPAQIAGGQLKAVYDLSAAAGEELAASQIALSDTMQAFGFRIEEINRVQAVFTGIMFATPAVLNEVAESMKKAAPIASSLGVAVEDLGVVIGLMADAGIRGSEAGTALRRGLINLAAPTGGAEQALAGLGVSLFDSEGEMRGLLKVVGELRSSTVDLTTEQRAIALSTIFGARAVAAWSIVLDASEESVADLEKGVRKMGVATEIAEFRVAGISGSLKKLKATIEVASIAMVKEFEPAIIAITGFLKKMFERFAALSPETKKWIGIIAIAVIALSPLLIIIGLMASGIGALIPVIAGFIGIMGAMIPVVGAVSLPLIAIIAIVAALAAVAFLVIKNWEKISTFFSELWDQVKIFFSEGIEGIKIIVSEWIAGAIETITAAWNSIMNFLSEIWDGIKNIFKIAGEGIVEIIKLFFTGLFEVWKFGLNFIIGLVAVALDALIPNWEEKLQTMVDMARTMWQAVKKFFQSGISLAAKIANAGAIKVIRIFTALKNIAMAIFGALRDFLRAVWSAIVEFTLARWNELKDFLIPIINTIASFIGNRINDAKNIWSSAVNIMRSVTETVFNAIQSKIEKVISFITDKIEAAKTAFETAKRIATAPIRGVTGFIGAALERGAQITGVKDAVIDPSGRIVSTNPRDFIIATQDPKSLAGGGLQIVFSGNVFADDKEAFANELGDIIIRRLNLQMRIA